MKAYFEALFSKEVMELTTAEAQHERACEISGLQVLKGEEYYGQLRGYLYSVRLYEMEEYYSGRELYSSLGATVRDQSMDMGKEKEAEYNLKLKNFAAMKSVGERLRELEQVLFGRQVEAIEKLDTKKFEEVV